MAAAYPTAVKTFTTKSTNDSIEASHPNDLQDEVSAIEDALLNGVAHVLKPSSSNTRDLGTTAALWRTAYLRTSLVLGQATANYTVAWSDPAAARALTIPDPLGDDSFVFLAATQTLTGKTLTAPTLGGTIAGTPTVGGAWIFTADATFNDNVKVTLGTGGDADLYYDGTDLIINPVVVGVGDVVVMGASIEFDDSEGVTLGTGKDATIRYDGTDLIISPAAVGVGDVVISGGGLEINDSESLILGTGKDATFTYDGTDLVISPAAVGVGDLVVTGASIEFDDNEGVTLGTGKDATLTYDGTDLKINPRAVGSGNLLLTAGDLYTTTWTDYSATSTVTGWASFTTKKIFYKKVGKTVHVQFQLEGTSDATSASFTVADARVTSAGWATTFALAGDIQDNSAAVTTNAYGQIASGASTVTMQPSAAGAGWTASGTKRVSGQFSYQTD